MLVRGWELRAPLAQAPGLGLRLSFLQSPVCKLCPIETHQHRKPLGFSKISSRRKTNHKKECILAWVAYEYPDFQGQQFILEKGDYPRWSAWSGSGGHHSDQLLSFRPVLCANHSDSRVTLFEGDNFQGCKFELSDDYPSLPSMGWASKDVGSLKVSSGAWVAYQYPGYRGYQYVLERDRHGGEFRTYSEFGTQAHTGQLQSIRRVQQ
ncbi:beta-crystallin A2 isoform X1 [Saccopteryx bilineata]|uniref:beta-crystallin A2 isoform X1 n=1 Tax=Saccopteryx bilineata TaxID=59482 RepID=UPI00338DD2FD